MYRDLIDFHDRNGRFAFSLPSESYLNYGLAGSFIVALIVGSLFGWAYRRAAAVPSKALHVLSPILVATLPLSLRGMLSCRSRLFYIPMIAVSIVYRLCMPRVPFRQVSHDGLRGRE